MTHITRTRGDEPAPGVAYIDTTTYHPHTRG